MEEAVAKLITDRLEELDKIIIEATKEYKDLASYLMSMEAK